jgi:hypothetical protein
MKKENSKAPTGRTVSITVYTAEELKEVNPRSYERAFNAWINGIWETFGSDYVEEIMREDLARRFPSLAAAPLRWSLSYCQGDGVAFDSFNLTTEQVAELGEELKPGFYFNTKNIDTRYSHRFTFKVTADTDEEADEEEAEATAQRLTETLRDLCINLEDIGYKASEHLTSETAFLDESNGELYDITGYSI